VNDSIGELAEIHGKPIYLSPRALFCCASKNPCRRWVIWLIFWKWFDHFITLVIVINSVILAMRDYEQRIQGDSYVSEKNLFLDEIGKVLSLIFFCECVLKIIG
jgi:hypothetical protein